MTPKQHAFVRNKLDGMSNRMAVIEAGYSGAGAKQRGTSLMKHPVVRAALLEGGFLISSKKYLFDRSATSWVAVSELMPKKVYDCPKEFLRDAMNCEALPELDRMKYAVALLPYEHKRIK